MDEYHYTSDDSKASIRERKIIRFHLRRKSVIAFPRCIAAFKKKTRLQKSIRLSPLSPVNIINRIKDVAPATLRDCNSDSRCSLEITTNIIIKGVQ